MGKIYKFEIQNCVTVELVGYESVEEARQNLIENLDCYNEEMTSNCTVSDGEEVD